MDSGTFSDLHSTIEQNMNQLAGPDLLARQMMWENGGTLFNDVGIYGKRGGRKCD